MGTHQIHQRHQPRERTPGITENNNPTIPSNTEHTSAQSVSLDRILPQPLLPFSFADSLRCASQFPLLPEHKHSNRGGEILFVF